MQSSSSLLYVGPHIFVTQHFSTKSRSEHERHSPNCPFVKGEHTQNVPLSVTLATSPAHFPNGHDSSDKIACYGFGSCPQFLAAATKRGKMCIWDVSKMMKVISLNCEHIRKLGLRFSTNGPEHPHVGACCGRWRERSMTYVAVHAINFTSHWTFYVNRMEVVKQSLLPVASRWRHHYYYIQTNISVQVGALM